MDSMHNSFIQKKYPPAWFGIAFLLSYTHYPIVEGDLGLKISL